MTRVMEPKDNQNTSLAAMDILGVLEHLPHRYPFLLVDRVLALTPGESIVALKNVSFNEPYFTGHFPGRPVMPGVLILEAMAQAAGILAFVTANSKPTDNSVFYFVGIDNVRFKQPVVPGDQLILEVQVVRTVRDVWKFQAEAKVNGKLATGGDIMCARRDA